MKLTFVFINLWFPSYGYTLVSYVSHPIKCVVLLSMEHYTDSASDQEHWKPDIITHYNHTKGAVDTLDKLDGEYTCKRQ